MYILYKTLIGAKPLNIRFDKIDRFIRIPNGSRYLVLFGLENYASYTRIRYLKKAVYSLLCKNQYWFIWFFTSRKNTDFA